MLPTSMQAAKMSVAHQVGEALRKKKSWGAVRISTLCSSALMLPWLLWDGLQKMWFWWCLLCFWVECMHVGKCYSALFCERWQYGTSACCSLCWQLTCQLCFADMPVVFWCDTSVLHMDCLLQNALRCSFGTIDIQLIAISAVIFMWCHNLLAITSRKPGIPFKNVTWFRQHRNTLCDVWT